jgi:type II secretion system protein E
MIEDVLKGSSLKSFVREEKKIERTEEMQTGEIKIETTEETRTEKFNVNHLFKNDKALKKQDDLANRFRENVNQEELTLSQKEEKSKEEQIEYMYKNFGQSLTKFLDDKSIIEIYLNQDGFLRIEKFGEGRYLTDVRLSPTESESILKLVADFNKTVLTRENATISTVLPNGERISGAIYDTVGHRPVFTIRKKSNVRFELDYYVKTGVITQQQKEYIEKQIRNKKNIIIAGNTSSGKTSFANACLKVIENKELELLKYNYKDNKAVSEYLNTIEHLDQLNKKKLTELNGGMIKEYGERIGIIEQVPELICNSTNIMNYVVTQHCSALDLLRLCMRMTPDRILYGELRTGEETKELLKAWNSGHDGGVSTIHASVEKGSIKALDKMEQYLDELKLGLDSQRQLIGESVDVIIALARIGTETGGFERKLVGILEVEDYDKNAKQYVTKVIYQAPKIEVA